MKYLKKSTIIAVFLFWNLIQTVSAQVISAVTTVAPSQTHFFSLRKSNLQVTPLSCAAGPSNEIYEYTGDAGDNYDHLYSYHRYQYTHAGIANADITNVKFAFNYNAHNQLGKPASYWANSYMSLVIPNGSCISSYWGSTDLNECLAIESCLSNGSLLLQGVSTNNSTSSQSMLKNVSAGSSPDLNSLLSNPNDFTIGFIPRYGGLAGWIDISNFNVQITYNTYPIGNNVLTGNESQNGGFDPSLITGSVPTGGNRNTYTYQWQSSLNNNTWTNIGSATAANYDPPAIMQTTYYRRITSSSPQPSSTSNVITKTVDILAPTGLASNVSNSTSGSVYLSWNASAGATSYAIYDCSGTLIASAIPTPYYMVNGLNSNTAYSYKITASNGPTTSLPTSCVNAFTLLNTPNVTLVALGTQITVSWQAVAGANAYEIHDQNGLLQTTATTSYVFQNLTPNTTYSYKVRAIGTPVNSAFSPLASIATIPVAPATLSSLAISSSAIQLSWPAVATASSYEVFDCSGTLVATVPAASTSYIVNGLSSNTLYSYKVTAKNSAGSSAPTPCASATTLLNTPVMTLQAVGTQITVSWAVISGATSYIIEDGLGATVPVAGTSYVFSGLAAGGVYTYKVKAINGTVQSLYCTPQSAATIPLTPGSLSALALSNSQIQLTWSGVSTATSYDVFDCSGNFIANVIAPSTVYTITGLSSGTLYSYKVVAKNAAGAAAATSCASAMTQLDIPTGLTSTQFGCNMSQLSWNSVYGATSYDVYSCAGTGSFLFNTTSTTADFQAFGNTGSYSYKVIAKNSSVYSVGYSNCATITLGSTVMAGTASASSSMICPGTSSSLITLTNYFGDIQWQSRACTDPFQDIPNATSSTYTETYAARSGTSYRAKVTCGRNPSNSVYSNTVTIFGHRTTCNPTSIPNCEYRMRTASTTDENTASGEDNNNLKDWVKFYPNPVLNDFILEFNYVEETRLTVTVYNALGEAVYTFSDPNPATGYKKTIDLSSLRKGIYFVKVSQSGQVALEKIIKE